MKFIIVLRATDDVLWRFNNLPKRWVTKNLSSNNGLDPIDNFNGLSHPSCLKLGCLKLHVL